MDVVTVWVLCSLVYLFLAGMTANVISEELEYELRPYANAKSFALGLFWPLVWIVAITLGFFFWLKEK